MSGFMLLDRDALGEYARPYSYANARAHQMIQALFLAARGGDFEATNEAMKEAKLALKANIATAQGLLGVLEAAEWVEGTVSEQ